MPESPDARAARLRAEALDAPTISEPEFRTRSRRAFLVTGAAAIAGVAGWQYLKLGPQDAGIPRLLRNSHEFNEAMWEPLISPDRLAPTFPRSAATMVRLNGMIGLRSPLDPATWQMRVLGPDSTLLDVMDLDDVKRLPKVEMTTELKCIEGWSTITHWAGARFSDFAALFATRVPQNLPYVGLATPDGAYTVGMDMASMMHPQTLLAYEMMGAPLTGPHGAPLRLVTPVKYGVKHLKRIGTVRFMAQRPQDFWADRGYDWYIGH